MSVDHQIKKLELERSYVELQIAQQQLTNFRLDNLPSRCLPIQIKQEGSNWVCVLHTSPDLSECPIAYGESPQQAMNNFDHLWFGLGVIVDHPDDEDELEDL